MIVAELKSFGTSDGHVPNFDLRGYAPDDPQEFNVYVEASIGARGSDGADIFGFTVCSAKWLLRYPPPKGFQFSRILLLESWSYELLERALTDFCNRTDGPDWTTVAEKLSRYAYWEFEDYTP